MYDYPMALFQRLGESYPLGKYRENHKGETDEFNLTIEEAQVTIVWYPKAD